MLNQSGKFKAVIKIVITAVVIYFLAKYIKSTTSDINFLHIAKTVSPYYLIASFITAILYVLNYSIIWQYITRIFDCNIPLADAFEARFHSEFWKYVPGKALSLASIVYYYDKKGISKTRIAVCLAFESILIVISSILIFLVSIPFSDMHLDVRYKLLLILLALLLFLIIHPVIFNYLLKLFFSFTNRVPAPIEFSYVTLLRVLLLYSLNWTLAGVSFYCLVQSLQPVTWHFFFTLNSISALAGFIGFVSIFTPAGIGVKEASMIYFLSAILPASVSSISTILSRLWLVAAELVLLAAIIIYFLLRRVFLGLAKQAV